MQRIQKILMMASLLFIVICLGATIWAALALHDPSFYLYTVVFILAFIWFGITIYKSFKK